MSEKTRLKLSPPWTTYYRELCALFGKDPDIKLFFDEETPAIKLSVKDEYKAKALKQLLPSEVLFGNMAVDIIISQHKGHLAETSKTLWEEAFDRNPVVSSVAVIETDFSSTPVVYVEFVREVVQFFNDDLSDPHGICSTLYQNIAKNIFGDPRGVYFCTATDYPDSETKMDYETFINKRNCKINKEDRSILSPSLPFSGGLAAKVASPLISPFPGTF